MNRTATTIAIPLVAALALAGCSTPAEPGTDRLSIVASTDVYASIATAVAGDRADITAIIDDPAQDPHSYEASARDRLALTEADVIIANGGGYDPFIDALLGENPAAHVLVAVELSGLLAEEYEADEHDHADDHESEEHSEDEEHDSHNHVDGLNEHVWYHLLTAKNVAAALAAALTDLDPQGAASYDANREAFQASVDALIDRAHELEHDLGHLHVVLTEPAPQYLIELIGADNVTPEAFTSAIEAGFDVPASALLEVLRLIEQGDADLVVWNEQTSGPQIERVVDAARDAGIPVISVTETLPVATDYLGWMSANLDAIEGALAP